MAVNAGEREGESEARTESEGDDVAECDFVLVPVWVALPHGDALVVPVLQMNPFTVRAQAQLKLSAQAASASCISGMQARSR